MVKLHRHLLATLGPAAPGKQIRTVRLRLPPQSWWLVRRRCRPPGAFAGGACRIRRCADRRICEGTRRWLRS